MTDKPPPSPPFDGQGDLFGDGGEPDLPPPTGTILKSESQARCPRRQGGRACPYQARHGGDCRARAWPNVSRLPLLGRRRRHQARPLARRQAGALPSVLQADARLAALRPQALARHLRLQTVPAGRSRPGGREMGRVIIGIDVGLQGAVAILADSGALIDVQDMPCLNDGPAKRRSVNAALLSKLMAKSHATEVYVDLVGPRRQEGPVGAFAFGRSRRGSGRRRPAPGRPSRAPAAPQWKRLIAIAPGKAGAKDAARSEAIRRWPDKAGLFARKLTTAEPRPAWSPRRGSTATKSKSPPRAGRGPAGARGDAGTAGTMSNGYRRALQRTGGIAVHRGRSCSRCAKGDLAA